MYLRLSFVLSKRQIKNNTRYIIDVIIMMKEENV